MSHTLIFFYRYQTISSSLFLNSFLKNWLEYVVLLILSFKLQVEDMILLFTFDELLF